MIDNIYNKNDENDEINKNINTLIDFIKKGQEQLYIDILNKEIIILLSRTPGERTFICFINAEKNKKELIFRYREDWDFQRATLSSTEYYENGNEMINIRQKDKNYDCLFYTDEEFEEIMDIIYRLYENGEKHEKIIRCYNNYDNLFYGRILNSNNIEFVKEEIEKFYEDKYEELDYDDTVEFMLKISLE